MQDANPDQAKSETSFVPALRFKWATGFYDWVMRNFVRDDMLRRLTIDAIAARDGEKLLDFGCGTGTLTLSIANRHKAISLYAYDIDEEVLCIAKAKAQHFEFGTTPFFCHVDITDLAALPAEDLKSFDCITSSLLFHHLTTQKKRKALESIQNLMKPGGRLVLVDWGPGSNILLKLAFLFVRLLDGFSVTRDNAQGRLPEIMKAAGFSNVSARPLLNTFFGTIWLFEAIIE